MATTVLEIIDTAVKIGLGALITGSFAYFMSNKKYNNEMLQTKLDAKRLLIKEATLCYEDAFSHMNCWSHEFRKNGGRNIDASTAKSIAESLIKAKVSMNSAESSTRLAGLTPLAECYENYSTHIDEMNLICTTEDEIDFDKISDIVGELHTLNKTVRSLMGRAYDDIYAE